MGSILRSIEKKLAYYFNLLPIRQQHSLWHARLEKEPRLNVMIYDLPDRHLHTYIHGRWRSEQKLHVISHHNEYMLNYLSPSAFDIIYRGWGLIIGEFGDQAFTLKFERGRYKKEGEQGLYIRNREGQIVFGITFVMDPMEGKLFIGSLQGGKHESSKDDIKELYRLCHGLRPIGILVSALYGLKTVFGLQTLYGVPARFANNGRHGHKIKLDYDNYWQECGAVLDGVWYRLPDQQPIKDVSEVKSKHRSAYRKRVALMSDITSMTEQVLLEASSLQTGKYPPNTSPGHFCGSDTPVNV